ncbi:glutathione S-transferase [Thalassovita mediterranea]|jgi:glutathione S-transferase|uniref:Putative GST-like protein YibF n=1 Tax=Thalassovita mediterranea TaxID=340021 RepID=A0A0P1GRD1_9RHOB|nr:glutathione S-transferase [Thalassovita mediterranea]MCG7573004.1 glutathione S-transferase [Phaeobacter sp. CNT1-3]CUH85129.1 putative GST-like protein YibF [Thalassovita mediterranea]SIS30926.1 glutathione S-transferase [Thalassovita mediterranea]
MKLIYAPTSPYSRKVRVLLAETGQSDDIEMAQIFATPVDTPDEVQAANPMGKIPSLVREEGTSLYDSRVICQFLDERADAGLYPAGSRWEVMTLEATADGILDAAILMVYERRIRPPQFVYPEWEEAQWVKVARAVQAVNDRWMSHLAGPLTMGHIAVACALGYLDFRHPDRNWRKGCDALDDWYAVFSERDSMKATVPPA